MKMNPTNKDIHILKLTRLDFKTDEHTPAHDLLETGEVYRAIKDFGKYAVYVGEREHTDSRGIIIDDLTGENQHFAYEFQEITQETLLDLDLTEEQLTKVSKWLNQEDHTDMIREVEVKHSDDVPQEIIDMVTTAMAKFEAPVEQPEIIDVGAALDTMFEHDPDFAGTVCDLLVYLASTFSDKYANPRYKSLSRQITKDSGHGKGANLFNAIKYCERYLTEGYSKSDNPTDLLKAVHYLLFELQRRNND